MGSHSSLHPYRAEETDGGVAEVQSVLHVCLVHSQLTPVPVRAAVATTVRLTALRIHPNNSPYHLALPKKT